VRRWFLVSFVFAAASSGIAQVQYSLLIDRSFSQIVGAENVLSLHKGIYTLENKLLKTRWFDEETFGKKALGISYRLGKTIFLDNVIDYVAIVGLHEIFGHGSRLREVNAEDIRYQVNPPPPYGRGGGSTYGRYPPHRIITIDENLAMVIGGTQATTILSNSLRYRWLTRGKICYRESLLYFGAINDLTGYVLRTKSRGRSSPGNDVVNYIDLVNERHGYVNEEDYRYTVDDLAKQVWINAVNPFQYYSLYTYFITYVWNGKGAFPVPMIDAWGMKYLPSFRMGITPFGSEFYFENFVVHGESVLGFYVRLGEPTFSHTWGVGFQGMNLVTNEIFSLSATVDIWNQPPLVLADGINMKKTHSGLGGAISATGILHIGNILSPVSFLLQVGYKTSGFLLGETLQQGLILRAGLSILEEPD